MSEPLPDLSLQELYDLIEMRPGVPTGHQRVKVSNVGDPIVKMAHPLAAYEGRVYFFLGLFEGFCRPDGSITERFRMEASSDIPTKRHFFDHALFTIPWFPDFVKTNAARCLYSVEASVDQENLFDYIRCQLVIDRRRRSVWKVSMVKVKIPDPVTVDARKTPGALEISVFLPYQWSVGFHIVQKPAMVLGTPEVRQVTLSDLKLKALAEEHLK